MTDPLVTFRNVEKRFDDFVAVRADFPALAQEIHGKPLVYLDNAATSQKPQDVIDAYQKLS